MSNPTFKPADIAFVYKKGDLLSTILAWFMQSQWAHTATVLSPTSQYTFTTETSDFESTIGYIERYINDTNYNIEVWSPKGISDAERSSIANATLVVNYGGVYAYLQFISLGIRALLARIGIKIPNFIRWGYTCDELVLYGYSTQSSLPGFKGFDYKSIQTQELYEKVTQSGLFERVY